MTNRLTVSGINPTGGNQGESAQGELCEQHRHFFERVRVVLKHDFHQSSRTHIVFCSDIGRRGVKGFGDFADEARRNFEARLTEVVSHASAKEIERWTLKLNQLHGLELRAQRVAEEAARPRMGEYSLGLDPDQARSLQSKAGNGTINAGVVEMLRRAMDLLEEEATTLTEDALRERIVSFEQTAKKARRERGEEIEARTFRMEPELHARLHVQAYELGVKLSELCRYALAKTLNSTRTPATVGF